MNEKTFGKLEAQFQKQYTFNDAVFQCMTP